MRGRSLAATAAALGRGEEDDRGGKAAVGWAAGGAGPAGLPGEQQVGFLLFFNFSSICFI